MKRTISVILLLSLTLAILGGCYTLGDRHPIATIKFSDGGTIRVRLFPEYAPNTVANFISLAESGFYDGSPVHRVIEYFVIQMGQNADGKQIDYTIKGEFSNNGYMKNKLQHGIGSVSMARVGGDYDSATSQFFIVTRNHFELDGDYAPFGLVWETSGLDELTKIARMDTDANDVPRDEIYIVSVTVDTFGKNYGEPKKIKN